MEPKKILVVDDDIEISELLGKKLESEGFKVEVRHDGKGAISCAKQFQPDLIVMDLILPDIDGADAVRTLQEDSATGNIPVLFLSGMVAPGEAPEPEITVSGQAYRAIGKPFSPQDLIDEVRRILRIEV